MKKIYVDVTKNCIKRATRGDGFSCPISLAMRKYLRKGVDVMTDEKGNIDLDDYGETNVTIDGTRNRARFIKKFDGGTPKNQLKPFRFSVRVPESILKSQYV